VIGKGGKVCEREGTFTGTRGACAPGDEMQKHKNPDEINSPGFLFWRRPTLARPIAVLPSGLQRFTAVFGMGTGGATALMSPECGTALAVSLLSQRRKREAESLGTDRRLIQTPYNSFSKEHDFQSAIFAGSLISTYRTFENAH
jgi:hypothetical protein